MKGWGSQEDSAAAGLGDSVAVREPLSMLGLAGRYPGMGAHNDVSEPLVFVFFLGGLIEELCFMHFWWVSVLFCWFYVWLLAGWLAGWLAWLVGCLALLCLARCVFHQHWVAACGETRVGREQN